VIEGKPRQIVPAVWVQVLELFSRKLVDLVAKGVRVHRQLSGKFLGDDGLDALRQVHLVAKIKGILFLDDLEHIDELPVLIRSACVRHD
jgi:hypothetical protein